MLILNLSDGANFNAATITLEWRSLIKLYLANCFLPLIQGNKIYHQEFYYLEKYFFYETEIHLVQ